jgi:hypothetical protein
MWQFSDLEEVKMATVLQIVQVVVNSEELSNCLSWEQLRWGRAVDRFRRGGYFVDALVAGSFQG